MSSEALIAKFQTLPLTAQQQVERLLDLLAEQSKANGGCPRKFKMPDILARLERTWGQRTFTAQQVAEMRAAELEGEAG